MSLSFSNFLIGLWKRNLSWVGFGDTFSHLRTTNTLVLIEELSMSPPDPDAIYLKWSFGKNAESEMKYAYVMKFSDESEQTVVEWQYGGEACSGIFNPVTSTAVFSFFLRSSTVTVTYRVVDADSISFFVT